MIVHESQAIGHRLVHESQTIRPHSCASITIYQASFLCMHCKP